MVEGQTDSLSRASSSDGVATSVLHLLDKVLVTLLSESATLLGIQEHIVGPDLEDLRRGAKIAVEVGRQLKVQADLVVLQGNQGQVQAWVTVEEEQQRQVHAVVGSGRGGGAWQVTSSGHLVVLNPLRLITEQLRVQAPPGLEVLVDTLTTNGQLHGGDGTLSNPVGVNADSVGSSLQGRCVRLQGNEHVTKQVTVASNHYGQARAVARAAVDRLLNSLHSKVGVALVHRLKEGNLGVTSQVNILSTVSHELH